MYTSHQFRLYPTNEQKEALEKAFGCTRWYWNHSLDLCQRTFKETGKGLTRNKIQSLLPGLKKEHEWLKTDVYSQCLQVVALNLSTAYKNFFEKRAGFPKFKSRRGKQSINYPQNTKIKQDCIHFPKLGDIYCRFTKQDLRTASIFGVGAGQARGHCPYRWCRCVSPIKRLRERSK